MKMTIANGYAVYADILSEHNMFFLEDETWLMSGIIPETPYRIAISVITSQSLSLLNTIIPLIKELQVPFRLVKNKNLQYRLNSGSLGESEIGRVVELYPANRESALDIVNQVLRITNAFAGPAVQGYLKLSNCIYASPEVSYPNVSPRSKRKPLLLKSKYLPLRKIHKSPKGDIIIALKRKGLLPKLVVAKQGRQNMYDDDLGRTVRDRLIWEQQVLKSLIGQMSVPSALDFFDAGDDCYSIINFIPGYNFYQLVTKHYEGQRLTWAALPNKRKLILLAHYKQAVTLIREFHLQGFVHRDVNLKNFIIDATGKMFLIDFELTHNLQTSEPETPFFLGMAGFVSPEQRNMCRPATSEDIFSLGALLFYVLTTHHPVNYENKPLEDWISVLQKLTVPQQLIDLTTHCLFSLPEQRPSLDEIIYTVQQQIAAL